MKHKKGFQKIFKEYYCYRYNGVVYCNNLGDLKRVMLMYNLKERDAIKRFLNEETVNTSEAIKILGFTRQYLNQLVKVGN